MKFLIPLLIFSHISLAHIVRAYPDAPMEVITIGHPTLELVAEEVDHQEIETQNFQIFLDNLYQTMRAEGGVGIAAPQVNVSKRVFVMKPGFFSEVYYVINPVIEYLEEEGTKKSTEGCLSIPGRRLKVDRYKKIHMSYTDRHGVWQNEAMDGFKAIVAQHEYDHLNGTLITDLISEVLEGNIPDDDIPLM